MRATMKSLAMCAVLAGAISCAPSAAGTAADGGGPSGEPADAGARCSQLLGVDYEPFETRCDGIDNDCNGVVDVSEPRLIAEGAGGPYVATMGMDVIELRDGMLLGGWSRGLQRLTPTFEDAGFELVPWAGGVPTSGGYIRLYRRQGGYFARTFGVAGSEVAWLNEDGQPLVRADGGLRSWLFADAGRDLYGVTELSNGDLFGVFQEQIGAPRRNGVVVLPADGGFERELPWTSGASATLFHTEPIALAGERALVVEQQVVGPYAHRLRVLEFDGTPSLLDAGEWIDIGGSVGTASILNSPLPRSAADARVAYGVYDADTSNRLRRTFGADAGELWVEGPLNFNFALAATRSGDAVVVGRQSSTDDITPHARLADGPLVQLVRDGGLGPLTYQRWLDLEHLRDGGFVVTFSAEDAGSGPPSGTSRQRYVYAVRVCLSPAPGFGP